MKQKRRYRRKPKGDGLVQEWDGSDAAELLRRQPRYVGSGEHKTHVHPSFSEIERSALRSDATPCPPEVSREQVQELMRRAFELGSVSEDNEGGFPRYFWAFWGDGLVRGRLINQTQGWYKAHPVEAWEVPADFESRFGELEWPSAD